MDRIYLDNENVCQPRLVTNMCKRIVLYKVRHRATRAQPTLQLVPQLNDTTHVIQYLHVVFELGQGS